MKIIRAKQAGFCFGVKRAVSIARDALSRSGGEPVCSLGPIIHNPQVVEELEAAGLKVVKSLDCVSSGTIIIRSHGAPLEIYREAKEKKLRVLDTTCPFVKKMHQLAQGLSEEGYEVVIFGDVNHPEITSLLGTLDFEPLVVGYPEEALCLETGKKVGLISQTTQSSQLFAELIGVLLPSVSELKIFNTICDSTRLRQEESLEIAGQVDVMIVIGGRNSANTRRLYELCRQTGRKVYHLEVPEELDPSWLEGAESVGVTAGASTPGYLIDRMIEKIKSLNNRSR